MIYKCSLIYPTNMSNCDWSYVNSPYLNFNCWSSILFIIRLFGLIKFLLIYFSPTFSFQNVMWSLNDHLRVTIYKLTTFNRLITSWSHTCMNICQITCNHSSEYFTMQYTDPSTMLDRFSTTLSLSFAFRSVSRYNYLWFLWFLSYTCVLICNSNEYYCNPNPG